MTSTDTKVAQFESAAVDGRKTRTVRGPKGPSTRVPWSGGLDVEELARPGGILLSMLLKRANELGHQLGQMADELGVTYGYISQLRTGLRKTSHISDAFATACALYLGAPRMTVLLASGRVKPEDTFADPAAMISALPHAIELMAKDPKYGPLMPPELLGADARMQYLVVTLFEEATGRSILPGRENPLNIAQQIQKFEQHRANMIAQLEQSRATAGAEE